MDQIVANYKSLTEQYKKQKKHYRKEQQILDAMAKHKQHMKEGHVHHAFDKDDDSCLEDDS